MISRDTHQHLITQVIDWVNIPSPGVLKIDFSPSQAFDSYQRREFIYFLLKMCVKQYNLFVYKTTRRENKSGWGIFLFLKHILRMSALEGNKIKMMQN